MYENTSPVGVLALYAFIVGVLFEPDGSDLMFVSTLAWVGHINPHIGAASHAFLQNQVFVCAQIHTQLMKKYWSSWAVFSPILALCIFIVGVLCLSAAVRMLCLFARVGMFLVSVDSGAAFYVFVFAKTMRNTRKHTHFMNKH